MDLGLLLGNTTLRVATFDAAGLIVGGVAHVPWSEWGDGSALRALASPGRGAAVVGSVRDDFLYRVEDVLPPRLLPPQLVRRDFALPLESDYDRPDEVGTDRLLNALAAERRAGPRGSIVVDFGTALSVSVVRAGVFRGGLIAPGAEAMLAGLRLVTPRLPEVEAVAGSKRFLARDSKAAIAAGVHWQMVGGVRAMLRGISEELGPPKPLVIATGGAASRFVRDLSEVDSVVPELTCEGLGIAWSAHRNRESVPS